MIGISGSTVAGLHVTSLTLMRRGNDLAVSGTYSLLLPSGLPFASADFTAVSDETRKAINDVLARAERDLASVLENTAEDGDYRPDPFDNER